MGIDLLREARTRIERNPHEEIIRGRIAILRIRLKLLLRLKEMRNP
jgi:hypothetical protein